MTEAVSSKTIRLRESCTLEDQSQQAPQKTRWKTYIFTSGKGDDHGLYRLSAQGQKLRLRRKLPPTFRAALTAGKTLEEARNTAAEALALHIAGMVEDGDAIPEHHTCGQTQSATHGLIIQRSRSR